MDIRKIHEAAWATTVAVVELLQIETEREFHAIYDRIRAGIEAYELFNEREAIRLLRTTKPSNN
jgi:hypothetical protein